jgi:hypothetical protein
VTIFVPPSACLPREYWPKLAASAELSEAPEHSLFGAHQTRLWEFRDVHENQVFVRQTRFNRYRVGATLIDTYAGPHFESQEEAFAAVDERFAALDAQRRLQGLGT